MSVLVAKAHASGVKVVLGVYPFGPVQCISEHPDWLLHEQNSEAIEKKVMQLDLEKIENHYYRIMCLINSPWGDYYLNCLAEILRQSGADGLQFDGNYHHAVCYCRHCKDRYKKDTGREIPAKVDVNDINYRIYLLWADGRLEDWYRRLQARMKAVSPESALCTWTINAGRYHHFTAYNPRGMSARMNLLIDCPVQEWWLDETHVGGSIAPAFGAAYGWAVTSHRLVASQHYLMTRFSPYGTDSFPPYEVKARALLALSNGSLSSHYTGWAGHWESEKAALAEVKQRSPWLKGLEPAPWAAMLFSEQTRQNYGLTEVADRYLSAPFGIFRATMEEHQPLTVLADWDVKPEVLKRYKVLVLPNTACLNDDQVAAVRAYVKGGGGLVATGDTSLFDMIGRPRPRFCPGRCLRRQLQGAGQLGGHSGAALHHRWRGQTGRGVLETAQRPGDVLLAGGAGGHG